MNPMKQIQPRGEIKAKEQVVMIRMTSEMLQAIRSAAGPETPVSQWIRVAIREKLETSQAQAS